MPKISESALREVQEAFKTLRGGSREISIAVVDQIYLLAAPGTLHPLDGG